MTVQEQKGLKKIAQLHTNKMKIKLKGLYVA